MLIFLKNRTKFLFFSILICVFFILEIWQIYPIYEGELFKDWTYIKNYAECSSILNASTICEELKKFDFIYPEIWLNVQYLPSSLIESLPLIIIFIFFLILIKILENENYRNIFLIIFSTPFVLVMQRGNNEMIIFILIYLSILLYQKKKNLFSVSLIFISSLLKIYPITGLLIFFKNKIINYFNLMILLSFLIFLIYIYDDLISISNNLHSKVTLTYSSKTIFYMIGFIFEISEKNFLLISIILFLLILIFSLKFKINLNETSKEEDLFIIGASILIFSFFLSSSFEYRLIYTILLIPFISMYRKKNLDLFKYIYFIIIFIIWFEFIIFYTYQYINFGELKNEFGYILNNQSIFLGILIGIKNFCYWILNFFLIIIMKEIFMKRLNF